MKKQLLIPHISRRSVVKSASAMAALTCIGLPAHAQKKKPYVTRLVSKKRIYKRGIASQKIDGPLSLPDWPDQTSSVRADNMLMFRGNPTHTQYGSGEMTFPLSTKWKHRMIDFKTKLRGKPIVWQGTGWTGQAIAVEDYVFVGSVGRSFYAFEADGGKMRWRLESAAMFKSSPCYYKGHIYVGSVDNLLRAIDASTGDVKWAANMGADCDSSPCVVDGKLYICGESGHARCLVPETGEVLWETFLGGVGRGTKPGSNGLETSPAISNGELFAASYDGKLFCLDVDTGKVKWTANTQDDTDASPLVTDEFVYAASEEKASHVYCFDRNNKGALVWRFDGNKYGYWSSPALSGNTLYIGGQDDYMYALNARTGALKWSFKTKAAVWSSPAVVNDVVIFGSYDHHLYFVNAQSGELIQKIPLSGRCISTPIVHRGKVYVGTATGTFYCFG